MLLLALVTLFFTSLRSCGPQDITAGRLSDCSHALNCVAQVATAELARELAPDVVTLLASPRPYIRKKATLTLYSLVAASPDILPAATVRLKDRLVDSDSSVVCAAVTVVAQLAAKSPRPFLVLAPLLYRILTDSHNNWLLIKVVKLFGVLAPLEPRLARKLASPLATLMKSTKAKSLLYECCSTVSLALLAEAPLVALAADHLGQFILDADQNLKYLGLAAMRRLAARFPAAVMPHRGLVLDCLEDPDVGIRLRALDLVGALVYQDTFREVFDVLLDHLEAVAAVASRASVAGLAGSGGAIEEESSGAGGGAGRHALSAIDTDAPFREVLATRLLDAGVYVRPAAASIIAASSMDSAPQPPANPPGSTAKGAQPPPVTVDSTAAAFLSTADTPVSQVETGMSSISLTDPVAVDDEAARRRNGGYLQLLTEDDFEWYVTEVLGCVARCSRSLSGAVVHRAAAQLVELPARVPAARQACVELALQLMHADCGGTSTGRSREDGPPAAAVVPASSSGVAANAPAVAAGGRDHTSSEEDSVDGDSDSNCPENVSECSVDSSAVVGAVEAGGATPGNAAGTPSRDATPLPAALLAAAAWLIGEYAPLIPRPAPGVVAALLAAVPAGGGARCVSSALKLYASVASGDTLDGASRVDSHKSGGGNNGDSDGVAVELRELLLKALPRLAASAVAEVQERASVALALVSAAPPGSADAAVLRDLLSAPLLPVDRGAQARLQLPPPGAAVGVDLCVPLLGAPERARLARDAAAAASVDVADQGLGGKGGRLAGRLSAAGRAAARGREASSLLSAVGDGSGGGGGASSRRGGVAPRRSRGERSSRGGATATNGALLIDVTADGDGGGGKAVSQGDRSRRAPAAILADVAWEPPQPGPPPPARGAAAASAAADTTDTLYGELDFGIGGAAAATARGAGRRGARRPAATGAAAVAGDPRGGGARAATAKPRRKAKAAAATAADCGDVGQLVDLGGSAAGGGKGAPRKARASRAAQGGGKAAPPPPTADSLMQ